MNARVKPRVRLKPLVISNRAVEIACERPVRRFEPYIPPAGVLPAGAKPIAMDSALYDYANLYANGASSFVGYFFQGYQELAAKAQLPEYRKMSEEPAREMVREWINIHGTGDDDKSEKIAAIEAALKRFNVREIFRKAAELDSFFGRAQIYVDLCMANGKPASEDYNELQTPLPYRPEKIKKGSLRGFVLVEPMWTYPSGYNANNPLSPDYYKPSSWFVMGKTVHDSRLLLFVLRPVPDLLKPAYNFGGVSMTQMAQPYVEHWVRTRDSVSDLVHSFSLSGIKTNLEATLTGADDANFAKRAQLFNAMRDNRGLMLLDKDSEEFFQFNTPLSGIHELQAQSQEQMAAVSNIPLVKLLGITPTGLNASSEGEIRVYYDYIASLQEALFRAPLEKIIQLIQLNEFGEIDEEIGFDFEPLYGMSELEQAQVRTANAQADTALVSIGALSPDEVRRKLANDPESGYEGLEVDSDDERENSLFEQQTGENDDDLEERADVLKVRANTNAARAGRV